MKALFFAFFLLLPSASYALNLELRGDWESAGDFPYYPEDSSTPFQYDCQLEVLGPDRIIALTNFTLSNKKAFVEIDRLAEWKWGRFSEEGGARRLPKAPKGHKLLLTGYHFSMLVFYNDDRSVGTAEMNIGMNVPWNDVEFLSDSRSITFDRKDRGVSGDFYYQIRRQKGFETLASSTAKVICDKVK